MRVSLPFLLNRNWFRDLTEVEKSFFSDKDRMDITKGFLVIRAPFYFVEHDIFDKQIFINVMINSETGSEANLQNNSNNIKIICYFDKKNPLKNILEKILSLSHFNILQPSLKICKRHSKIGLNISLFPFFLSTCLRLSLSLPLPHDSFNQHGITISMFAFKTYISEGGQPLK